MDPLTIALAIYGGYQGYRSAKKAGASGAGRIFGTALGAYGGYNLGQGIGSLMNAAPTVAENLGTTAITEGVTQGIGAFNPYGGVVDPYAGTSLGMDLAGNNLASTQIPVGGIQNFATQPQFQQLQPSFTNAAYNVPDNGVLTYSDIPGEQSFSYTEPGVTS
jgi:hypothetical protein